MRKLLVLSHKGGVGKTTTALNLAAAAALTGKRVLLLDGDPIGSVAASLGLLAGAHERQQAAHLALTGSLWEGAMPATDVLLPYSGSQFDEQDLHTALARLDQLTRTRAYDLIVMDAPPSLWQRSRLLLQAASEILIVLRCEPLAYRTLPGLLTLIKNSGARPQLVGILLTLPPGQQPGSELEHALLARLGARAIPTAIPHDPAASEALLAGMPLVWFKPTGAAAAAYLKVAHHLGLIASPEDFPRSLVPRERRSFLAPQAEPNHNVPPIPVPQARLPQAGDTHDDNVAVLVDPSLPLADQQERATGSLWRELVTWIVASVLIGAVSAMMMRWLTS